MSVQTVLTTDPRVAHPAWCRLCGQSTGESAADLTCEERHDGRVWHYDAGGFTLDVRTVAYYDHKMSTAPELLLRIANTETVESFSQNLTAEELDGLIALLQRAREDHAWNAAQ